MDSKLRNTHDFSQPIYDRYYAKLTRQQKRLQATLDELAYLTSVDPHNPNWATMRARRDRQALAVANTQGILQALKHTSDLAKQQGKIK